MIKSSRFYPRPTVVSGPVSAVGQAGGVLLTETIRVAGLSARLARWRRPYAVHYTGKLLLNLALTLALGDDCMVDVAVLRAEPGLFGAVASDPTVPSTIAVTRAALGQLPTHQVGRRHGRGVLVRTNGAGSSHEFLDWPTAQRLSHSVGFALPAKTGELLALMSEEVSTPAYSADDLVREGAWVAEITGMLNLTGWPKGCG